MAIPDYAPVEFARMTGFSVRQLDYWARHQIVVPSAQQSHGPGTRRRYTIEDLIQLRFIRQLKQHGWSTQKVRVAITRLRAVMNDPDPETKAVLVDGKGTILALYKTAAGQRILLDTLRKGGQQVLEIVLETLVAETQATAVQFADEGIRHG